MNRIQFIFSRNDELIYLSHLDLIRLFLRALRRSKLPVAYSQGFNPHPRFTLALPLPLGVTASRECGEIIFGKQISPEKFLRDVKVQLPAGLELGEAKEVDIDMPSLASRVHAALYRAELNLQSGQHVLNAESALTSLMTREEIIIRKINKKKRPVMVNVRPFILKAESESEGGKIIIRVLLKAGSQGGISPVDFITQLACESAEERLVPANWHLHREALFTEKEEEFLILPEGEKSLWTKK